MGYVLHELANSNMANNIQDNEKHGKLSKMNAVAEAHLCTVSIS